MSISELSSGDCPILHNLTPDQRARVLSLMETQTFPRGETILREGGSTRFLWIIAEGRCEVVKNVNAGAERQLAVLEECSVFGEMSFFHPSPHSASVRALSDVKVKRLSSEKFDELKKSDAAVAHMIASNTVKVLADRLRLMDDWIGKLVEKPGAVAHKEEWHEFRAKLYTDWEF